MDIMDIVFKRDFMHPEIWEEFVSNFTSSGIPEGYELKEKDEHKKERLKKEIEAHKFNIKTYKRYLSEEEEQLKNKQKELDKL
jgi:hypothetical protein